MQDVKSGDPDPNSAAEWNAVKANARSYLARNLILGGQAASRIVSDRVLVRVENNSGSDVGRFDILGIGDTVGIDPDDNLEDWQASPILDGEAPDVDDHTGKFVVCMEPIVDGDVGWAAILGVVTVHVTINDTDHHYADITDADETKLDSSTRGAARILFRNGDSGSQWCVVNLLGTLEQQWIRCNALTKGAVSSGDGTYTVDNVTVLEGESPVAAAATELTVTNRYADDIDDNANVSIEYDPIEDQWQTGQITCQA